MGFFEDMKNEYGIQTVRELKEYSNNERKLANLKNRRIYLLRCRKGNVLPNHLNNNITKIEDMIEYKDIHTGQQAKILSFKLIHKILIFQIDVTVKNLTFLNNRQTQLNDKLITTLPEITLLEFKRRVKIKTDILFHNIKSRNIRKFQQLEHEQQIEITTQPKWIKNLSDKVLPPDIESFLSLGPKFCLEPKIQNISIPRLLSTVENAIFNKSEKDKNLIRAKATNLITNHIQNLINNNSFNHINNIAYKTKKFLNENTDIYVMQADKGGATAIMNKTDYFRLSEQLLNDDEYYQQIPRDPTSTIEQKTNNKVSEMKKSKMISEEEAKTLMTYDGICPKYYGLPKIHKPNLTLRPIISSINSPTSRLSKFLKNILKSAYNTNNPYFVEDSFQFSIFINNFELPDNYKIISLDVVSLFTNILLEIAELSISNKWEEIERHCKIKKEKFLELIRFIFNSTYFSFDSKFYKQKIGTPMGSILSPIIAQYVMDQLLDYCIPKLSYNIPFCKKYVDDLILAIPFGGEIEILEVFHSFHPKIKFTIEEEVNNSVPFLDTLVIRDDKILKTDWYIKPISANRYIHYKSDHHIKMKTNLILNLKNRIIRLSHQEFREKNLKKLFNIMLENGYPKNFLNKLIYRTPIQTNLNNQNLNIIQEENTNLKTIVLPRISDLSNKLSKLIKQDNFRFTYKYMNKSKFLFSNLKDQTPDIKKSNVIYKIPCSNCNQVYIGETKRTLSKRITSHKSDISRNLVSCALAKHVLNTGHIPNYSLTKVLDSESNLHMRKFLELIKINQDSNNMNSRKDIDGVSTIYSNLLDIDNNLRNGIHH